jgi:hypothetical protein
MVFTFTLFGKSVVSDEGEVIKLALRPKKRG